MDLNAPAGGRRIGVFGGAFDPPHLAHVALAQAAIEQLGLDELRVLPTGEAWHKRRALTSAVHRLAMTRLAFEALPCAVVDDREIRRDGPTYTVDTLRELAAETGAEPAASDTGPWLVLVMGADQARALAQWHDWQQVVRLAVIAMADREGVAAPTALEIPWAAAAGVRIEQIRLPEMDISATDIRLRIAHPAAAMPDHSSASAPMVPAAVARYIAQHRLYLQA